MSLFDKELEFGIKARAWETIAKNLQQVIERVEALCKQEPDSDLSKRILELVKQGSSEI